MRWIYSELGAPMWEWPGLQSVMFYAPDPPFSPGGPPPMTDREWEIFEQARVEQYKRQWWLQPEGLPLERKHAS